MPKRINLLDLFSGIGGFHKGLEQAGFEIGWNGFSDIDKYANAVYQYNYPEAINLGSITTIRHEELPQIDCITFGSPCQDFSIAGKRSGMQGDRSSLITEAIRLIATLRPRFFIWENVKGTFSSNDGADFLAIIQAFTNIRGYRLEWQLLNTRWFLPQNRERIYLVGCIGEGSGQSIFPIGKIKNEDNRNNQLKEITKNMSMGYRVYDVSGVSTALRAVGGGVGAKTGLYQVETLERKQDGYDFNSRVYSDKGIAKTIAGDGGNNDNKTGLYKVGELKIKAKKRSHDTPKEINEYLKQSKSNMTISKISECLDLPKTQVEHYFRADKYRAIPSPDVWSQLKELLRFDDTYDTQVTSIYEKEVEFESSRRVYSDKGLSPTIDSTKKGGFIQSTSSIRRLTPVECCRLQGFPDDWNEKGIIDGEIVKISDTQRYKQCGNAVTVNVVQAVAERIYAQETKPKNISTKP